MTNQRRWLALSAAGAVAIALVVSTLRAATPPGRYSVTTNRVYDNATGLIWLRTPASARTWSAALTYCDALTIDDDFSDWRLPSVNELETLIDHARQYPSIDISAVPGVGWDDAYWSSSTFAGTGDPAAWFVEFANGETQNTGQSAERFVLCVHDLPPA